jgi:hypothetical protein
MPKLQRLGRLAGYRFVLREVSHPDGVKPGETLNVAMKWSNVGVGKLYRRYPLALYLLDPAGSIACRQVQAEVDSTRWLPGDIAVTGSLQVPATLRAGQYTLGVALIDPATEKPAIRLASDPAQVDRIYRLSDVTVK